MAVNLSPVGGVAAQFFDNSGNVLTGGKLYTYLAGTTTPATTYTTSAGSINQTNPIILDAAGRVSGSGEIWLTDSLAYKFVFKDSNDVLIATYDNITGINSNFVNFVSEVEIQTATAGQTVFTLTTMQYQPGTNNLLVFVDGVNQYEGGGFSFVETNSTTVTFTAGLHVGAEVKFTTATPINTLTADAATTAYTPPFANSVTTNVEAKLAQTVSVMDFGAVGDGITDDHDAILNAIQAVYTNGGGTVFFPQGVYATSPISMQGYSDIILQGQGQHYDLDTSKTASTIKIISTGDVGIQFCDVANPTPTWNAPHCVVENLTIDGNDLVTTCVNGNYNIILRNMVATNATGDGIVLEAKTYPAQLLNVYSNRHGGHGLLVRGPLTTKYQIENSRFDMNQGYGIYMQAGGGGVHIKDTVVQSNYRGGVKIRWVGNLYPTSSYFCSDFLFTNLYTEDNGLLDPLDPNYEGNFALVIQGNKSVAGADERPNNIRFVGGTLNPSTGGKTYSVNSVWGLDFGDLDVDNSLGEFATPAGANTVISSMKGTAAGVANKYPLIQSYGIPDSNDTVPYQYFVGGASGSRGRIRSFEFYLPSITAGTSVIMRVPLTAAGVSVINGYPMIQDGSVLAMQLLTAAGGSGTLTASWVYSYSISGVDPSTDDGTLPTIVVNKATEVYKAAQYLPLEYPIPGSYLVGLKLTASAGYVAGATSVIQAFIMIES